MTVPAAFRVQFGLLCLNHLLLSLVQAAKPCNTLTNVTRGTVITTKPYGNYMWCGQTTRHFLAVADNKLFYLSCSPTYPKHAVGSIFYLNPTSQSYQLFYENEMCDVKTGTSTTRDNSNILADMLEGRLVPYNANGCNPKHYVAYLTYGKIPGNSNLTASPTCPVFQTFTARTRIDNNFLLKDQQSYYAWPSTAKAGYLTPTSQTQYQVPKSPLQRNSSGNSRFSGWFGRVLSGKRSSPQRLRVTDKKGGGGGGGGGHGGGGGGHGSSSGGHGGEGSVGGGGEGSRGAGAGTTGYIPYAGAHGGRQTSAGGRPQPLFGLGNWAGYGYGYGGGTDAIGYRQ